MCVSAVVAGAGLLGSAMSLRASNRAGDRHERAARSQLGLQQQIYNETTDRFEPFTNAGNNALAAYNYNMGIGEAPEGYGGYQETPGYQFRFDEGLRALEGSAAATGNVRSGATQKAIINYGQGLADQGFGNHMNRLMGVAQLGQASAGNQAAAGINYATGAGNAMGSIGNAQSAGIIGQNNAVQSGINNAVGAYQMNQMMRGSNPLFGGNSWG